MPAPKPKAFDEKTFKEFIKTLSDSRVTNYTSPQENATELLQQFTAFIIGPRWKVTGKAVYDTAEGGTERYVCVSSKSARDLAETLNSLETENA